MSDKKFANLHYPGMKSNPDEGRTPFPDSAQVFFENQLRCIGDDAQRIFLGSSILILGSSPLATRLAIKFFSFGIGRVGVFTDQPASNAHGLGATSDEITVFQLLKKISAENFEWAQFEPFRALSIDRKIDDITRGFDVVVHTNHQDPSLPTLSTIVEAQKKHGNLLALAQVNGRQGSCSGYMTADQFKTPEPSTNDEGCFFPTLDVVAANTALLISEMLLQRHASDEHGDRNFSRDFSKPWKT